VVALATLVAFVGAVITGAIAGADVRRRARVGAAADDASSLPGSGRTSLATEGAPASAIESLVATLASCAAVASLGSEVGAESLGLESLMSEPLDGPLAAP